MSTATPDLAVATRTFEAPTAEKALADVHRELGPDARIVSAEKVLRGGVGGFFAREVVQIEAHPSLPTRSVPGSPAVAPESQSSDATDAPPSGGPRGLEAVLQELVQDTSRAERTFGDVLREQLGPPASALPTAPTAAAPGLTAQAATPTTPQSPPPTVSDEPLFVAHPAAPDDSPRAAASARAMPATPSASAAPAAVGSAESPTTAPGVQAVPWGPSAPGAAAGVAPAITADVAPTAAAWPVATTPDRYGATTPGLSATDLLPEVDLRDAPGHAEWSSDALLRLGFPQAVVAATRHLDPRDGDERWTRTVAAAVAPLCRPLPAGDAAMYGPRSPQLAEQVGIRVVAREDEVVPPLGSVAAQVFSDRRDRDWLDEAVGDRWRHVVVGGVGWRFLLLDDVRAVSWVGDEALPDALRAAADLGLVLGYGMASGLRAEAFRARPDAVARCVRGLVVRR